MSLEPDPTRRAKNGDDDAARRAESAAILRRIAQETEPQVGAAANMANGVGRHFGAGDADPADRIEVWGTRIGRGLSVIGFAVLAVLLALQLAG